ncbi:MAG: hypothetical protein LBJ64_12510 [Deltaproteobacteria bacterium]|nr:hypothetical protein [Deltaproteobacteria bacterium]
MPYLLKIALPHIYAAMDKTADPAFLETELRASFSLSSQELGANTRIADYVIDIPLKNGEKECLLLHIEIQGKGGGSLPDRMFEYFNYIFCLFKRAPEALAIITDVRPKGEALYCSLKKGKSELVYKYTNLVLSQLDDKELIASDNPFDLLFYAAKCSLKAKKESQKLDYLDKLTDLLGQRGWSPKRKAKFLLFLERIINLEDPELKLEYKAMLNEKKKEGGSMYITVIEEELEKKHINVVKEAKKAREETRKAEEKIEQLTKELEMIKKNKRN